MPGDEMGRYILATTTESEDCGPKAPGAINGGFCARTGVCAPLPSQVVIAVKDLGDAIRRVADGGGQVTGEPMEIPGDGLHALFRDTEGNYVSMLQPLPRKGQVPTSP